MAKTLQAQTAFNAGEWSPLLWARVDSEKYRQSARILENFQILPYGGIYRRPGFECLCEAKDQNNPARLVPWQFSVTDSYVLEFYNLGIRVFKGDTCKICPDSPDGEYTIATPYRSEDLNELQFAQLNDIMYIVHEDYPVHRLERYGDCDWRLIEASWTYPPLLPQNESDITLNPNGDTLVASADLFTPEDVGTMIELCYERDNNDYEVKLDLDEEGTSDVLIVQGAWDLATSGTWEGRLCVEYFNRDTGAWEIIYQKDVNRDRNLSFGDIEDCREQYRVSVKPIPSGDPLIDDTPVGADDEAYATLTASGAEICGVVRITEVIDAQNVKFETIKPIDDTAPTTLWSKSAWNGNDGYPRTVTFHEERLIFGGTRSNPQTLWGSRIDDYENFQLGTEDADSWEFTLSAHQNNTIQWIESQRDLMIGTTASEWAFGSGRQDESITPSNARARRYSAFGSAYRQATLVNDSVFFIQRGCRKVREETFSIDRDGYVAEDVTIYAEHITRGGVVQTAYQQNRDAVFWIVNGCGELAGLTYEKQQGVAAWHRHTTQGKFEGVAVIYGDNDVDGEAGNANKAEEDELWVTVKRECKDEDGNTITKRMIERMRTEHYRTVDECDQLNYFFVDCGKTQKTDAETATMTDLEHLERCTVQVYADGACAGEFTVTGGSITLDRPAKCITAGLQYESIMQTQGIELVAHNGTGMSRQKQVSEVALWIWKSLGGHVGGHIDLEEKQTCQTQKHRVDTQWDAIRCPDQPLILGEAPKPYSGWITQRIESARTMDGAVTIRQSEPLPFGLLALVNKFTQTGDES